MSSGSLAKTLLLPPLLAAVLYLLASYVLFPLYTRWRSHHRNSPSFLSRSFTEGMPSFFTSRRGSASSGGSLLGDEELEEGFLGVDRETDDRSGVDDGEEGRLSRELEGGFRDESSDEEEDEGRRGRLERG